MKKAPLEPRGLLASAYRGNQEERALLIHWYREGEASTLCRKVKAEKLVDPHGMQPDASVTCEACIARARKLTSSE